MWHIVRKPEKSGKIVLTYLFGKNYSYASLRKYKWPAVQYKANNEL